MNRIENAKNKYRNIEIPHELPERMLQQVEKSDKRRRKMRLWKTGRRGMMTAAGAAVVFTIGLNTSVTFAKAAEELPVLGGIAKVLTFRSYEMETEERKVSVNIPSIDMISKEFHDLKSSVNLEIYRICETYAAESVKRAEEYRQAFLDTGGTEEEWNAHNIEIKVWYEVKSQTEKYLSLVIYGTESWSSAYSKAIYYNFDLESGKPVVLKDILGENYGQIAKEQIQTQIHERGIPLLDENLPEIKEDTKFYMKREGVPVIVFEKYEIAPGAYGAQEFEIIPF